MLIIGNIESEDNIYPLSNIRIEKGRISLFELKRRYEQRGEIILNPDFQRESVWSGKQKSGLIESLEALDEAHTKIYCKYKKYKKAFNATLALSLVLCILLIALMIKG